MTATIDQALERVKVMLVKGERLTPDEIAEVINVLAQYLASGAK